MDVHHPHHPTHKKKWTEYLLEFFMLFLAVFLGFVAENVRENIVERHRENEYIISLVQDLKTDTLNLAQVIDSYVLQAKRQDSLIMLFDSIQIGYNKNFVVALGSVQGFRDFIYTDATLQQLKSSGGFRLIRNKKVVDSINAYAAAVNRTYINTNDLGATLHEMSNLENGFINYHALHKAYKSGMQPDQVQAARVDMLISHNKKDLDVFFNRIIQFKVLMFTIRQQNFVPLKSQAERLISFLQKEYHLEKE